MNLPLVPNPLRVPSRIVPVHALPLKRSWDANWQNTHYNRILTLRFDNERAGGRLTLFSALPQELEQYHSHFEEYDVRGTPAYTLAFGDIEIERSGDTVQGRIESFYLHPHLSTKDEEPQRVSPDHLHLRLNDGRRIVFYIGAGISAGAGVYAMSGLNKAIGIDWEHAVDAATLHIATHQEERVLEPFKTFCRSAFDTSPSPAHRALASLAVKIGAPIISENFDHLMEKTGVPPLTSAVNVAFKEIADEHLREIDEVWCLGLSHDARGFLGLYKDRHPQGTILAISKDLPSYMGRSDIFVEGDLQEILPLLSQEMGS